jgi:hypothetical protein
MIRRGFFSAIAGLVATAFVPVEPPKQVYVKFKIPKWDGKWLKVDKVSIAGARAVSTFTITTAELKQGW